jgi:hypothetical protein
MFSSKLSFQVSTNYAVHLEPGRATSLEEHLESSAASTQHLHLRKLPLTKGAFMGFSACLEALP